MDSSLSKAQKVEALETLEQDARQLAEASSEGMGGGERDKLHEVLIAEDALTFPVADAYETVLQDLRSRQERDPAIGTRALWSRPLRRWTGSSHPSRNHPPEPHRSRQQRHGNRRLSPPIGYTRCNSR